MEAFIAQAKSLVAALGLEWYPTLLNLVVVSFTKRVANALPIYHGLTEELDDVIKDFSWGVVAVLWAAFIAWLTTDVCGLKATMGAALLYGFGSIVIYLLLDKAGLTEKLWLKEKPKA